MKQTSLPILSVIVVFLAAFLFTQPASAHGGDPRLEINAGRLSPGSSLELRGVDFEADAEIGLSLVGPQTVTPLGPATADVEGIFQLTITLPADLSEGTYSIRAASTDHDVDSPPFVVSGIAEVEGGEQRDLEEPLLAPMPTVAPGPYPTSIPQTTALDAPARQERSSVVMYAIAAGLGFVALLGIRILKRR